MRDLNEPVARITAVRPVDGEDYYVNCKLDDDRAVKYKVDMGQYNEVETETLRQAKLIQRLVQCGYRLGYNDNKVDLRNFLGLK